MSTFCPKKEKEKEANTKRKAEGRHVAIDVWEEGNGRSHPWCEVGYKGFGSDWRLCVGVSDVSLYWCAQETLRICNGGQRRFCLYSGKNPSALLLCYLFVSLSLLCLSSIKLWWCVDIVQSVVSVVGFKVLWAEYSMGPGVALHCQVEHHVRDKKILLFLSCITNMDQFFFMSRYTRYLLHTKNS